MKPIIKVENLSKQYRLGTIGTGTLRNDFTRLVHRMQGKEDPFLKIGETNDRSTKGSSDYVWALKDINFEVMPGEVLGIIGKNGAGKSTLLKILSKVTGPTTGRINYNGRIGSLLEVGTGFHPELTGRENIFLNGAILGMTKAEIRSKIDEIIDFSGCERYIDTPVKRYSSGMTVRLGFAVAAHLEPEILVVDEVLAVGDAEFQKKAIGKMQEVSRNDGRTVLFVSHNMAAIENLCTQSLLIEKSKIKAYAKTTDIIHQYLASNKDIMNTLSISERTDRAGSGINRIDRIAVRNGNNDTTLRSFDSLHFNVQLARPLQDTITVRIVIGVYEESNNNPLFRVDSDEIVLKQDKAYQEISIETSGINLVEVNCYLNAALYINGNLADHITHAIDLQILEKTIDGVKTFKRNLSTILISTKTHIQ